MTAYVTCPLCSKRIDLVERKDFESFTHREYQEHVKTEHPEAVGPVGIPYAATRFDRRTP